MGPHWVPFGLAHEHQHLYVALLFQILYNSKSFLVFKDLMVIDIFFKSFSLTQN